MNKIVLLVAVAAFLGAALPAHADTFLSVSVGGPGHGYHGHHGPIMAPMPVPVYAPPVGWYMQPRFVGGYRPTTIVYVQPLPLNAVPVSEVYLTPAGQQCREYQTSVMVGNQMSQIYGTACLMPDGSWRVVQ